MDREILFRAKRVDNGEWIEGLPSYDINGNITEFDVYKGFADCETIEVDPKTVCRCTGVPDKNNKKIFEGDIVKRKIFGDFITGQVVWSDIGFCGFQLKCGNTYYHIGKDEHTGTAKDDEVIGNIFDNPELLEAKEWEM